VGQDVPDIDLSAIEVDRGYQPVLVATDVEHHHSPHLICQWKGGPKVTEALERSPIYDLEPPRQCSLTTRMFLPEKTKGFS
jgi:hypothetical protein